MNLLSMEFQCFLLNSLNWWPAQCPLNVSIFCKIIYTQYQTYRIDKLNLSDLNIIPLKPNVTKFTHGYVMTWGSKWIFMQNRTHQLWLIELLHTIMLCCWIVYQSLTGEIYLHNLKVSILYLRLYLKCIQSVSKTIINWCSFYR